MGGRLFALQMRPETFGGEGLGGCHFFGGAETHTCILRKREEANVANP